MSLYNNARVEFENDLLRQLLGFPPGTKILACTTEHVGFPPTFIFVVHHDDLRELGPGEQIPKLSPTVERITTKFSWNQPAKPAFLRKIMD